MNRKWLVNKTNREYISYLSNTASISNALAQVLINRGIKTPSAVIEFLSAGITQMSESFEMDGVALTVDAIIAAKTSGKRVLVHGDYDVDGLTATAIMVSALRAIGIDVHYFIPDRFSHGYGLGVHAVKLAKEMAAGLIITVDCGITSFEAVAYANKQGIDVIITDHHEPERDEQGQYRIPPALAVVNPKLAGVADPVLSRPCLLSGAGVALKIAQALRLQTEEFLDLAALGTLADIVPLIGENRIIVKEGLGLIREGRRQGIMALKTVSGLQGRQIKAGHLSFTILPRINAAGRMSCASDVVELLLSESRDAAFNIASELDKKNSERQRIEEAVYQEALAGLTEGQMAPAIVLAGEGWHEGVIGIVASRIAEQFYRPTFILSIKGEVAKGSARSIPGFDIYKGLLNCKGLLISFGGHRQAAGIKIKTALIDSFRQRISALVEAEVKDFTPSLQVDADIGLEEVSHSLIKELEALEPFGCGNSEPLFGSKGLEVINPRVVGNSHLKMKLKGNGRLIEAIGFDMGGLCASMDEANTVDAVFTINMNEWNGSKIPQLSLKALRQSQP